jgi:hypothetical protein
MKLKTFNPLPPKPFAALWHVVEAFEAQKATLEPNGLHYALTWCALRRARWWAPALAWGFGAALLGLALVGATIPYPTTATLLHEDRPTCTCGGHQDYRRYRCIRWLAFALLFGKPYKIRVFGKGNAAAYEVTGGAGDDASAAHKL